MRTRTIFEAWHKTIQAYPPPLQVYERDRKRLRQNIAFQAEFERRMDHYDWYEARQRYFDESDPLGYKNGENNAAREAARLEMNAAYMRFAAHPREQAKADAWRKENGI